MLDGPHGVGGHRSEVGPPGAGLFEIDLLQRQQVRIQPVHALCQQIDVDSMTGGAAVQAAATTLAKAGFRIQHPPEDWLFKAELCNEATASVVVDVLYRLNGDDVDDGILATADPHEVLAITMPVLPPSQVMLQKLCALGEHDCDYATLLPAARATREQIDWQQLRHQTSENPYATGFLDLAERLHLTTR